MSGIEGLIREVFAGRTHQFSVVRTQQGFQGNAVRPGGKDQRIAVEIKPDPVEALRCVLMRVLDRDAEVNGDDDLLGIAAADAEEDMIG